MKLVIEIGENEYIGIKSFPNSNTSYPWTLHLYDAVRNGTPLPKGHGRLIDADKILYDCTNDVCGMTVDCYECPYHIATAEDIYKLPTIIEADKEREE